jgi:predicted protein tyrosine phosphatase
MPDQSDNRLRRFLFVCLENRSRSPTAEWEARLAGFDADSAGVLPKAMVPLSEAHARWADIVICMAHDVRERCEDRLKELGVRVPVFSWGIPDDFNPGDAALVRLIRDRLKTLVPLKHMIPDVPVEHHANPRAASSPGGPLTPPPKLR